MSNNHTPVMLNEVKSFIPNDRELNLIDATFGGGGYSKSILEEFKIKNLVAIDRDPVSKVYFKELRKNHKNIELFNERFSKIDELINNSKYKNEKFDVIIFDIGVSSNQIDNSERGFSFQKEGPLDMNMGSANLNAFEVINSFKEEKLADIFFKFGEERFSRRIAKNIIISRNKKSIDSTIELSDIIKKSIPFSNSSKKTHPATKTFQALRIYVNDELNELKKALEKSENLLSTNGFLIIVSFQSLEDRIVKDFFNHKSGKRWRSSRHLPDLGDLGPITLKIITKKPLRPKDFEISNNPRSRSAKLRVAQKI
ncbi:MAG: 16S rRNA (cytosine(1402)-N(4))-methyltransferase RsmH [Pelagibacteraceae bacterium]|nr:16S rRNA (cytosine(1402)-N(4))-methyltransferase RsmH [Pelagibacteraceae bacterium]